MTFSSAKIYRMHPDVELPMYSSDDAACLDLRAYIPEDKRKEGLTIRPGETLLVHTGLRIALPSGWELQIRPRSGMSLKTKFRVANSPGTIDADYRGEICVVAENITPNLDKIFDLVQQIEPAHDEYGSKNYKRELILNAKNEYVKENSINIKHGDRICQAKLEMAYRFCAAIPLIEVDSWDDGETRRGAGGFGSTGKA